MYFSLQWYKKVLGNNKNLKFSKCVDNSIYTKIGYAKVVQILKSI